nr:HEXXH motif-containing putative peptide modification protein [Micromonospora terminaliae]
MLGRDAIGYQEFNELLSSAAECARSDRTSLLGKAAGCGRIGGAYRGYVWTDTAVDSVGARRFKTQCLERLPGFRIEQPKEEELRNISEGAKIVNRLLPELGRSALSHTFMVVLATTAAQFGSLTVPGLPGTIFLSPRVLTTPVRAGEAILHESMHLKFMDVDYTEHLFSSGFRPQLSPKITPPWHNARDKQEWPLDRLLTAMHVYTALAVFYGRMERAANTSDGADRAEYPADTAMKYQRAIDRAYFLANKSREYSEVFSGAGMAFIEWIAQILKELDSRSFRVELTGKSV